MPESELSDERLACEAQVILGAATITTGATIAYISYYILARPDIRLKLQEELKDFMVAWPQQVPTMAGLEQLPYLQALIKEGLRYAWTTPTRAWRSCAYTLSSVVIAPQSCIDYHVSHPMSRSNTSSGQYLLA